jgi:hypothetical protein
MFARGCAVCHTRDGGGFTQPVVVVFYGRLWFGCLACGDRLLTPVVVLCATHVVVMVVSQVAMPFGGLPAPVADHM